MTVVIILREVFLKSFLHLKPDNFKHLMTSMLLFFKNASLKIMTTVIFGSFHSFWRKKKYITTKFKASKSEDLKMKIQDHGGKRFSVK